MKRRYISLDPMVPMDQICAKRKKALYSFAQSMHAHLESEGKHWITKAVLERKFILDDEVSLTKEKDSLETQLRRVQRKLDNIETRKEDSLLSYAVLLQKVSNRQCQYKKAKVNTLNNLAEWSIAKQMTRISECHDHQIKPEPFEVKPMIKVESVTENL